MLSPNALKYLSDQGLTKDTATESQISKAKSYASCYDWYINNQKVLPENAELASKVWVQKYALLDSNGICLEATPEDMWHRISKALAKVEVETNKVSNKTESEWESEFYDALVNWKYSPAGSGLYALGNPYVTASVSNCFVLNGENYGDSLEGIFDLARDMGTLFKNRGGVGTDISHLRPKDAPVSNAARTSSGAVSFMDLLSNITSAIGTNGRRSALMITMRVDHIDIMDFIKEKQDLNKTWFFDELAEAGIDINDWKYSDISSRLRSTTRANISVKLTDKFLDALETDSEYELWYEFDGNKYPRMSKWVKAKEVWEAIISSATLSAEPGLLYYDHMIRESVGDCYSSVKEATVDLGNGPEVVKVNMKSQTTNPCLSGDTLVMTVNGPIQFKDLVTLDYIDVYSMKPDGSVCIRTMRNPRQTSFSSLVYDITMFDNTSIRCTYNHNFYLVSSNSFKQIPVSSLKCGDVLLQADIQGENVVYSSSSSMVMNVREVGYEPVYNGTVDDTHNFFIVSGDKLILSKNCGEQFLPHANNCCLGSFYLYGFVNNPWTENAEFDFESFKKYVRLAVRMQDNIKSIDIKTLPLKDAKIAAILDRRLGLGCNAVSDSMASLGFKYDTEDAIMFSRLIYNIMKETAYLESVNLAEEKGAFPICDVSLERDNPFLNRFSDDTKQIVMSKPRRNIMLLTNAPGGSLSILCRNCSSGIEPCFKLSYTRNVKKQGSESYSQYLVNHQALQDCINSGGNTNLFIQANDINPSTRIKLQSNLQQEIDASISSTVNLPFGTTKEEVGKLYMDAFKSGCKGITAYVEGSRSGILVSNADKKKKTKEIPKSVLTRPKTTDVDIFKTRYKDNTYMILIGKMPDGTPIECFGGLEDGVSLPTKYEKAQLVKKSRGHYSLTIQLSDDPEDVLKVNNISNRFPSGDIITITRMISLALKNNVPVSDIVEQLTRSASSLYDAPAVFARVLKNYIPDEEYISKEKSKGEVCPECGGELDIRRESGCISKYCTKCSYFNSKCN